MCSFGSQRRFRAASRRGRQIRSGRTTGIVSRRSAGTLHSGPTASGAETQRPGNARRIRVPATHRVFLRGERLLPPTDRLQGLPERAAFIASPSFAVITTWFSCPRAASARGIICNSTDCAAARILPLHQSQGDRVAGRVRPGIRASGGVGKEFLPGRFGAAQIAQLTQTGDQRAPRAHSVGVLPPEMRICFLHQFLQDFVRALAAAGLQQRAGIGELGRDDLGMMRA